MGRQAAMKPYHIWYFAAVCANTANITLPRQLEASATEIMQAERTCLLSERALCSAGAALVV